MTSTAIIIKLPKITTIVRFKDFLVKLLQRAPIDTAGIESPPISAATIFAMGIKIKAGRKITA